MKADYFQHKIMSLDDLERVVKEVKDNGRIVVQCHGVFDLLHPGHIRHFEAAKNEGNVLIVTITMDKYVNKGPGRPVFNQHLRAESIAALQSVDFVAVNEWPTAVEAIRKLKPNVYVKGSDYATPESDITSGIIHEKDAVESVGGRIHFTNEITFSSSELLNNHFSIYSDETRVFLDKFKQKYSAIEIIEQIKKVRDLKVLIIGETIIDEYHYCRPMGKSPKDTIISTKYISEESFAGGVLACANHIANFCNNVHLVTCLGKLDTKVDFILDHLKPNIETKFFYRNDAATIVKRRFVDPAFLSKMYEVSFLEDSPLPEKVSQDICNYLGKIMSNYDLVLVTDYGHGFFDDAIINLLCEKSGFLAVNTQTNSANIGFNPITKYNKLDYFCIDEPEIRIATHDRNSGIKNLIAKIAKRIAFNKCTVTRGHLGSVTCNNDTIYETPIFSTKIVDRVGAGDAFLAITSPCVANNMPMDLVGFIGNAVGAMAVGIVCNRSPIEAVPLFKYIDTLLK